MDGEEILLRELPLELAHGLDERQALDVTDGAAHFRDDDVIVAGPAEKQHAALDLVGDVGNDLDGLAEIGALALLGDNGVVDAAGGDVVGLGGINAEEAFIMPEVEVRLRAVFRDVALPVLVRIQRARIDIEIGVEFLDGDTQAACLEKLGEGCGDDALSQR